MVVGSQMAITKILVDLNLMVQYRIAVHKFWAGFNLTVVKADHQTAKFSVVKFYSYTNLDMYIIFPKLSLL